MDKYEFNCQQFGKSGYFFGRNVGVKLVLCCSYREMGKKEGGGERDGLLKFLLRIICQNPGPWLSVLSYNVKLAYLSG